ncbi:MAG: hypothetical protein RKE49_01355 [Oceanicaulis sp.]
MILLALALAGCATPVRSYDFPATQAGAMAAGERMLSQPEGFSAEFIARLEPESVDGPHARFLNLTRYPLTELRNPNHSVSRGICEAAGRSPGCDPQTLIQAVFLVDRRGAMPETTYFSSDMDGVDAVRAALSGAPGGLFGYAMIERRPSPPGFDYRYTWERAQSVAAGADFACIQAHGYVCLHRRDIRSIGAVFEQPGTFKRTFVEYGPPGGDMALSFARAEAAAGPNGYLHLEIKRPRQPSHMPWARIYDVTDLGAQGLCGTMSGPRVPAAAQQCVAYSDLRGFTVRDRKRNAGQAVLDAALFPFRFLGAVATAGAMSASGG